MDDIEFVNSKILSSGEQTECKGDTYIIRSYRDSLALVCSYLLHCSSPSLLKVMAMWQCGNVRYSKAVCPWLSVNELHTVLCGYNL